jgi:hypothetical protein
LAADFIKADELLTAFEDAKKFMLPLFQPFDEFERIARNKPHPGIAPELPKVTDGTLAAIIQETPKRIIQQIPSGSIKADDEWLEIVAGFILEHEIIPNSNQVAALIQKAWAVISKGLTYGSQPAFVQFINRGDYFGTDFTLPYIRDVLYEPGKLSDRDSNVEFLRTWWSKSQINQICAKETMLAGKAKDRGETYEQGWDCAKLQELIEEGASQKDAQNMTPSEKDKQLNNGFYEIVHCFQRGIGATFYSFAPKLGSDDNVVRRKKNPDPRGLIPIHTFYANIDLSNPLGRGSVEMSGGMQNLLDSEVQSYQYMRALLMNPPLKVRGNVNPAGLKYAPHAIWNMGAGSPEESDVEPIELSTRSLEQFPNNYGLIKSQILNLNSGGNDNAVSASSGDPSTSKTQAGVQANTARLGISDNYIRKQFESWFEEIQETEINLWFAERHGTQTLTLDDDTAAKLKKINPLAVNRDNQIRVNYDTETPKLKFEVDASSSGMKEDQEQMEAATNLLDIVGKYPQFDASQTGKGIDTTELLDRIVSASGLEDSEKVVIRPELGPDGQPIQPQHGMQPDQVQQMIDESLKKQVKPPSESLAYKDAPEDIKRQIEAQAGLQPSTMASPVQQDLNIKQETAQVNAIDKAHQHAGMQQDQRLAASDQAVKVAGLQAGETQAQNDMTKHSTTLAHQSSESAAQRDAQAKEAEANRKAQAESQSATLKHQAHEGDATRKAAAETAKLAAKNKPKVGAK